jgi:N-acetylneuraminic acid mutarotase
MRYLNVCFLGLAVFAFAACNNDDSTTKLGNWITRADFGGDARSQAASFVIGDTAYVGTGFVGVNVGGNAKDFWSYDPVKDNWSQVASLIDPANPYGHNLARTGAVGFAIGNMGYICTGSDSLYQLVQDLWAFDPSHNTWAPKAPFPGQGRLFAVAFSLKGFGFVGSGNNGTNGNGSNLSDFYKYDPNGDSWSPISSIKDKRSQAIAFVINDSAYVVTGKSSSESGLVSSKMFVYDVDHDTWFAKSDIKNSTDFSYDDDYTTLMRSGGVGFVMNGKGYITAGTVQNTWEYDPINDRWTEKTAFDGASRTFAVGFTVKRNGKDVGYITTGTGSQVLEDMKEFNPTEENDVND